MDRCKTFYVLVHCKVVFVSLFKERRIYNLSLLVGRLFMLEVEASVRKNRIGARELKEIPLPCKMQRVHAYHWTFERDCVL